MADSAMSHNFDQWQIADTSVGLKAVAVLRERQIVHELRIPANFHQQAGKSRSGLRGGPLTADHVLRSGR